MIVFDNANKIVKDDKEPYLISWNGNEPKYDIRAWSPDYIKIGKGEVLTKDELKAHIDILVELL